ncbi:hypothetical protein GF327_02700 [Candidatus Woesearchaeota archaeon]|nr:hypothetical protein [Candidatus Woesearchaeota archaeon]
MLDNLEYRIEEHIEEMPFIIKLFYRDELSSLKHTLEESRALRENHKNTSEWYINYGNTVNRGFGIIKNAVDKTYDIYEGIKRIPVIGGFLSGLFESYLDKKYGIKNIPEREHTLSLVENLRKTSISAVCMYGEAATDNNYPCFQEKLRKPAAYIPEQRTFYDSFIDSIRSINDYTSNLFGKKNVSGSQAI